MDSMTGSENVGGVVSWSSSLAVMCSHESFVSLSGGRCEGCGGVGGDGAVTHDRVPRKN